MPKFKHPVTGDVEETEVPRVMVQLRGRGYIEQGEKKPKRQSDPVVVDVLPADVAEKTTK